LSDPYTKIIIRRKEKEQKMTIKVTLLDGSIITPSYDPIHAEMLMKFYSDKFFANEILEFEVL